MISLKSENILELSAPPDTEENLLDLIQAKKAKIAVIGLGYVGLPLAINTALKGFSVYGFDKDKQKIKKLKKNHSYIGGVKSKQISQVSGDKNFHPTYDFSILNKADVIIICVPTPLTPHLEPDLSYIIRTCDLISRYLTPGTLIILESTTYPGTTHDVVVPCIEKSGKISGVDFYVAFSPEREDPDNTSFETTHIPKIVSGEDKFAQKCAIAFYERVFETVVPVTSTQTAEAIKLTENIFRSVNIALVNELKVIFEAIGIDIWEVIEGASTKPFGYMPFYPGPGVGGHCIPIDPFYLTWKAREYGQGTRFVQLAGEINAAMPSRIVYKIHMILEQKKQMLLKNARILISGLAYKKNVADVRESPAVQIFNILQKSEVDVDFYDPYVDEIPHMRHHPDLLGTKCVAFESITANKYDLILITTDHDDVDYAAYAGLGILIVDTRNVFARLGLPMDNVIKA